MLLSCSLTAVRPALSATGSLQREQLSGSGSASLSSAHTDSHITRTLKEEEEGVNQGRGCEAERQQWNHLNQLNLMGNPESGIKVQTGLSRLQLLM